MCVGGCWFDCMCGVCALCIMMCVVVMVCTVVGGVVQFALCVYG